MNAVTELAWMVAEKRTPTKREIEVGMLISEGLSIKEAAARLNIATKTADAHAMNLRKKLGVHSSAQLVKRMIELGYVKTSISPVPLEQLDELIADAVRYALARFTGRGLSSASESAGTE